MGLQTTPRPLWARSSADRMGNRASQSPSSDSLNQLDFVALRSIEKCDNTAGTGPRRAVGERIAFGRRFFRKSLQIRHFEREMRQIRADFHGSALVELANLDQFLALRRL